MVKRYYHSLVSLKYSIALTSLAMIIFILAFFQTTTKSETLKIVMFVVAVILAIVMFFYYKTKLGISREIKKIEKVDEYYDGGMVDQSYILEDRMLVCHQLKIKEHPTSPIQHIKLIEGKYGKVSLEIQAEETYTIPCSDLDQAQRLTAFLKRKNENVSLEGITPKGNGTLKELGAEFKLMSE